MSASDQYPNGSSRGIARKRSIRRCETVKHGPEAGSAMKVGTLLASVGIRLLCSAAANASVGPDDFVGYWKTAEGDGIVQ